jgi:hypothetical protein
MPPRVMVMVAAAVVEALVGLAVAAVLLAAVRVAVGSAWAEEEGEEGEEVEEEEEEEETAPQVWMEEDGARMAWKDKGEARPPARSTMRVGVATGTDVRTLTLRALIGMHATYNE